MTHSSASAYASSSVFEPRPGFLLWAPGLRLLRRLSLRRKAQLLLLCSSLPPLLAWLPGAPFGPGPVPGWTPLGLAAALLLPSLYAVVCLCMSLFEGLELRRRSAQDAALQQAGTMARQARELADAQAALQLEQLEIRGAVGEIARRTIALCGLLDAAAKDAERAAADLEAIQDEERHALQLMSALRARLLVLAQHCQALSDLRCGDPSALIELDAQAEELGHAASTEIVQCHQLSERVGGAERLNERRIESMRLAVERLLHRAERGMLEAQQLMVLTRQIQAAQAAAAPRLEQLQAAAAAAVPDGAS